MSYFKWYRKWKGGYWVRLIWVWYQVSEETYLDTIEYPHTDKQSAAYDVLKEDWSR